MLYGVLSCFFYGQQSISFVFVGMIILAVLILMSYVYGCKEYRKFTKRIVSVEAFNQEVFQTYKHFSLSNQWLVYHKGNEFVPFLRQNIVSIYFDGKKILIDEADKNGVFVLNGNAKENQMIQDWYHTNA